MISKNIRAPKANPKGLELKDVEGSIEGFGNAQVSGLGFGTCSVEDESRMWHEESRREIYTLS